jgi:hypothetical protein
MVFPELLEDAGELAHESAQYFVRTARLMISLLARISLQKNGGG